MTSEVFDRATYGAMSVPDLVVAFERIVGEAPEKRNKLWMLKRMEQATSARVAARRAAEGASYGEAAQETAEVPGADVVAATAPALEGAPPIVEARDEGGGPAAEEPEVAVPVAGRVPVAVACAVQPTAAVAPEPEPEERETSEGRPERVEDASAAMLRDAEGGIGDTEAPRNKKRYIPARFRAMSLAELHAVYACTVGRPTKSSDIPYLCWRITGAERLQRGPAAATRRSRRLAGDGTPRGEAKAVTLREYPDTLEAVEGVCARHGMRNRLDFFRRAAHHYLEHLGEGAAAAFFAEMVPTASAAIPASPVA